MTRTTVSNAIAAASAELSVQVADTPALVHEALRVRHQVYCIERSYEPGQDGLETDSFDAHSSHVVLRARACGTMIGTARLILPQASRLGSSFPIQSVCKPPHFIPLPILCTAEVSRFALRKDRAGLSAEAASFARLALLRGGLEASQRHGITHWCAAMEPVLLRLLRATAVHFEPMGPLVEYHGLRQPSFCGITAMLRRLKQEQPAIWGFVTNDGAFSDTEDAPWTQRRAA